MIIPAKYSWNFKINYLSLTFWKKSVVLIIFSDVNHFLPLLILSNAVSLLGNYKLPQVREDKRIHQWIWVKLLDANPNQTSPNKTTTKRSICLWSAICVGRLLQTAGLLGYMSLWRFITFTTTIIISVMSLCWHVALFFRC